MYTRVSQRLDEGVSGPSFYPIAEIIGALNEAQRFFVMLTLALETTVTFSIPAYGSNGNSPFFHMLQYYTDWLVPLRIRVATGEKIRPATMDQLTALDPLWWNSPGTPTRYTSVGVDLLGLYQQPASAGSSLRVTYARAPLVIAADTDVPEIPEIYHASLIDYAVYRMRQVEGAQEFAKTLPLLDSYLENAGIYAKFIRARNIGEGYDRGPLELEAFDRSKLLRLMAGNRSQKVE